jgi:hypothetical protein
MKGDRVTFERKAAEQVKPVPINPSEAPAVLDETLLASTKRPSEETKLADVFTGLGYLGLGILSFACLANPAMMTDWWQPVILPIFAAEASVSIAIPFCVGVRSQSSELSLIDSLFPTLLTVFLAVTAFFIAMQENGFGDQGTGGLITFGAYIVMLWLRLRDVFSGSDLQRSRAYTLTLGPSSMAAFLSTLCLAVFDMGRDKNAMWVLIAGMFFTLLGLFLVFMDFSRLKPIAVTQTRGRRY